PPGFSSQRDFATFDRAGDHGGRRTVVTSHRRRPRWLTFIKWSFLTGLFGLLLAVVGYFALIHYFEGLLPEITRPEDYLGQTVQVNRVVSAYGEVLAEYGSERRTVVPAEAIPPLVRDAVLAAEDADFYSHDG